MHKLVLASRNRNKIAELQAMFSDISPEVEILSLDDIGCEGDIVEDGDSYEENSVIKSCVPASKGYIGVADDSGLSVDALDGAPGVYSARYAGAHVTYTDNNEKLLKVMENIDDRGASFVCVMSITVPDSLNISIPEELVDKELSDFASARCGTSVKVVAVRGECRGEILREFRGCDGFGYDPLFLYKPFGKTFAQMSADEKNSVSHRGRAVEKFKAALDKLFAQGEDSNDK